MALSNVCWLQARFLKVIEASQSPVLGALFNNMFLGFLVTVTSSQVCLPEVRQTPEGTFHDGNRLGKPENS